jgi:hypothetical protein
MVGSDASISVHAGGLPLITSAGLELSSLDGTPAHVSEMMGGEYARAVVDRTAYRISTSPRPAGGGALVETIAIAEKRSATDEPQPFKAVLRATLPSDGLTGGHLLFPALAPAVEAGEEIPLGGDALEITQRGRCVQFVWPGGQTLAFQTETPSDINVRVVEGEVLVKLAAALFEPGSRVEASFYVGRRPYAGKPVIMGTPRARYVTGHEYFEARVRAFGAWHDPFDPSEVSLRAVWRSEGTLSQSYGFYSQDHVSFLRGEDDDEREVVEARGFPSFWVRIPVSGSGSLAALSFSTREGHETKELRLPAVASYRILKRRAGTTLGAPRRRGTVGVEKDIATLASESVFLARLETRCEGWWLLAEDTGAIDLMSAWRLDQALGSAGAKGVSLILLMFGRSAANERAEPVPAVDLRGYAAARWGVSRGFGGWETSAPLAREETGVIELGSPGRAAGTQHADEGPGRFGPWERSWRPLRPRLPADVMEAGLVASGSGRTEADHTVVDVVGRELRHDTLWTAAAALRGNLVFGNVELEEAAPLIRYLDVASEAQGDGQAFFFKGDQYEIVGSHGREAAKWWCKSLLPRVAPRPREDSEFADDADPEVVRSAVVVLEGMAAGVYRIEWWQTYQGERITSAIVRSLDGALHIPSPPFLTDVAGFAVRIGEF